MSAHPQRISPIPKRNTSISAQEVSNLIGTAYSDKELQKALTSIGCAVKKSGKKWNVLLPSWRPDLHDLPDLAEEVARYFGYDRIPSILPSVKLSKNGRSGLTQLQLRKRALALKLANRGLV